MELENLRDSWHSARDAALSEQTEENLKKITARVAAGKIRSSTERLRRRWRLTIVPIVLLPAIWTGPLQLSGIRPAISCWIVFCLFVASVLTHLVYFLWLLDRCDPVVCTMREISETVVRLRRSFLRSRVIHLSMAALLLVLIYRQPQPFHEAWVYGFWFGLAVGLPIGIHLFLRILGDINVLARAVRELDE